ncbi:MAG: FecR domain-containing protein [Acidobacteria bacterium]|nr:FecR domain-containing protein [Acidobacteriota bacterium]
MNRTMLAVLTLTLAAANQLSAQDADPSGRGVARLSMLNGDVSVRRGDTGETIAAAMNGTLMGEDQVLTGPGSRAEVQFDYGNFARLSENAEFRLADIENNRYLLRLARGTMTYRVLRATESQAEISTPSIAIRPMKKGSYRVSVLEDGSTEVTVRSGEAEIFSPKGTQRLKAGRTMLARGNFSDPEFQFVNAPMADDWDRWNESRDRQLERSRAYDYVSQDIYGAEDLDNYGQWESTPDYGNVWVPNTSVDWAPYRYGRWTWADYYGWNWVSYDPWGWAPYHYGRWINRPGSGWCWWPGQIHGRHYWSPGLVGFFGWGNGGFSASIGFGHMGWVPLAPFETYYPWYGRGYYGGYRNRTYNNVTIINNTNITNIYRNARVDNGITSVRTGDFGRGSVNNVRFNRNEIQSASMVRGQLPLVPDAHATRMSDRESRIAGNRASRSDDRFFATRQATRVDRVPFENQRSAMQETSRRTFGDAGRGGEVANTGGRGSDGFTGRVSGADRGATRGADNNNNGWRRMGDSNASAAGRGADMDNRGSSRSSDNGGWRRFGDSSSNSSSSVDRGASRGSDTGSWRRFGDSTSSTPSSGNPPSRGGDNNNGWRRMGESPTPNNDGGNRNMDRGSFGRGAPATDRSGNMDRGSFGRSQQPQPSMPSMDRGGRGNPPMDSAPRMSAPPPVVRERSNPDGGGRGGFGGFGGGGGGRGGGEMRQSAPHVERSAPSAPSGGGNHGGGNGGGRGGDNGGGRGGDRGAGHGGRNR